jgi:hypothetical protein
VQVQVAAAHGIPLLLARHHPVQALRRDASRTIPAVSVQALPAFTTLSAAATQLMGFSTQQGPCRRPRSCEECSSEDAHEGMQVDA